MCVCFSLTLSLFLSRSFSLRLSLSPSLSLSLACVQITYISECVRVCVLSCVCVYFLGQAEAACDDELLCRRAHATNTLSILHSGIHHIDPQNTHTDNPDVGGAAPYRHSAGAQFTRFTTSTKSANTDAASAAYAHKLQHAHEGPDAYRHANACA